MPLCKFLFAFKETNSLDKYHYRPRTLPCEDVKARTSAISEELDLLRRSLPDFDLQYSHTLPMESEFESTDQLWNWAKSIINPGHDSVVLIAKEWVLGEDDSNPNKSTFNDWFEGDGYYDFHSNPPIRIILKDGKDFYFRGLGASAKS